MTNTANSNGLFRSGLAGAFTCCALAIFGCQNGEKDVVDVQGCVTYQGRPVSIGTMSFSPKSIAVGASQRPATAVLDAEGTYRLKAFRSQFGMPPGDYLVSVLSYEGSMLDPTTVKYLVPKKFSDSGTSGLVATVPESHSGTLKIDFDIK
jgi:hypothetical protein